ncbi:DUF3899 domain-containing protein [Viridibacillus sp. FSL R5-0477]|uniref:DUF3899 domain-containing protein n=1 Tax=Viridibacillus arenosi FSL R5-213 TaxID=1227360 RepID=W4F618_9BACL|nr:MULTISPECIES: DUF3899 domain-containing protein [Viridibacillus]ETT87817.1 hypothetical protein C176_02703 [Viridibacillus arenosi FSL R5-213]
MKKKGILFLALQFLIVIIMFFQYKMLRLIDYINISFIIGAIVLFVGLTSYILSSGFFDIFTVSMRKVFVKSSRLEDVKSMRAPSEIVSMPYLGILQIGGATIMMMFIALIFYYL